MSSKPIAIIGAGAAGLMAAVRLVELGRGEDVVLIERNKILGHKVMISGGGRCNVTTGLEDMKQLLKQYPRGARFLKHALYNFPPMAMRQWMESHGVPLKKEADGRIFPKSDQGKDVVAALERVLRKSGVQVWTQCALQSVEKEGDAFLLHFDKHPDLRVQKLLLSVGGQAYRHTGSKGDGYSFAEALGHSITPLGPSLNAFLLQEAWPRQLSGLAFPRVALRFKGQESYRFEGPILFTHKGVSGPAIFAVSAFASYENLPAELFLDLFPDQTAETFRDELLALIQKNSKKEALNVVAFLLPRSFAQALLEELQIPTQKRASELSKKELNRLVESLKNLKLTVKGRLPGDEFVTAGGVELSEVDPKSMSSKHCLGLYFAGEILNYDGFTGGFNLQAAWATGRLAGESLSRAL